MDEIDQITFLRGTNQILRDEIQMLNRQIARLEDSKQTWQALAEAYRILSESQTNGNA
jgi:hypothetical protein